MGVPRSLGYAAALAACVLAAPLIAQDSGFSGNTLLRGICKDNEVACLAYIRGVAEGYEVATVAGSANAFFCVPAGADYGQARDIVVNYLRDNPGRRHLPASYLVAIALRESWPCAA